MSPVLISFFSVKVSQTIARGGPRSQIAIPAQGMIEFRDALTDLLEEFGTDDGGFKGPFKIDRPPTIPV